MIGSGNTIAGFGLGVFAMRTGGQRWIIIRPSLDYGDSEQSTIPVGSVLIFNVEVCSLNGTAVDPDCAG